MRLVPHSSNLAALLFQSTHPVRGATGYTMDLELSLVISIHAPRAGCDPRSPQRPPITSEFQSTHPVRGATPHNPGDFRFSGYFNPRTPCGVRPARPVSAAGNAGFQSTHPVRGATSPRRFYRRGSHISIHAPRAGCDWHVQMPRRLFPISIHAPRAGCDLHVSGQFGADPAVQSTHPVRGATRVETIGQQNFRISIHAPRAGGDY